MSEKTFDEMKSMKEQMIPDESLLLRLDAALVAEELVGSEDNEIELQDTSAANIGASQATETIPATHNQHAKPAGASRLRSRYLRMSIAAAIFVSAIFGVLYSNGALGRLGDRDVGKASSGEGQTEQGDLVTAYTPDDYSEVYSRITSSNSYRYMYGISPMSDVFEDANDADTAASAIAGGAGVAESAGGQFVNNAFAANTGLQFGDATDDNLIRFYDDEPDNDDLPPIDPGADSPDDDDEPIEHSGTNNQVREIDEG
ncbi:MAG: hypothetical protein FWD45_06890, partial [Coriobacteriia bacterium]|nr:hypothetical protein [Coriobacteriia bacterium]